MGLHGQTARLLFRIEPKAQALSHISTLVWKIELYLYDYVLLIQFGSCIGKLTGLVAIKFS